MAKRVKLMIVSVVVVAFAVPALASAAPAITDPPGTVLEKGKLLEMTSIGAVTVSTSLGKFSCPTWTWTMHVNANGGSTFQLLGTGQGTSANCTIGGKAATGTDFTLTLIHSATVGSGTMNLTFHFDAPSGITCHFASASVPFTYTAGGDVMKITNGDLVGTPAAACEPGLLNAEFTIETDGGGAVILD